MRLSHYEDICVVGFKKSTHETRGGLSGNGCKLHVICVISVGYKKASHVR